MPLTYFELTRTRSAQAAAEICWDWEAALGARLKLRRGAWLLAACPVCKVALPAARNTRKPTRAGEDEVLSRWAEWVAVLHERALCYADTLRAAAADPSRLDAHLATLLPAQRALVAALEDLRSDRESIAVPLVAEAALGAARLLPALCAAFCAASRAALLQHPDVLEGALQALRVAAHLPWLLRQMHEAPGCSASVHRQLLALRNSGCADGPLELRQDLDATIRRVEVRGCV